MAIELENVLPSEIEKRSFEIITEELTQNGIDMWIRSQGNMVEVVK